MERETSKTKKQRYPANVKAAKPACGTLSYLSGSRGAKQKAGPIGLALPDSNDKLVRK